MLVKIKGGAAIFRWWTDMGQMVEGELTGGMYRYIKEDERGVCVERNYTCGARQYWIHPAVAARLGLVPNAS